MPAAAQEKVVKLRIPTLRYLGFEITKEGREYTLRAGDGADARTFVLFIPHSAFASGQSRYQDAPDICYRKLGLDLKADPTLAPTSRMLLTAADLLDYQNAHRPGTSSRKRGGTPSVQRT